MMKVPLVMKMRGTEFEKRKMMMMLKVKLKKVKKQGRRITFQ